MTIILDPKDLEQIIISGLIREMEISSEKEIKVTCYRKGKTNQIAAKIIIHENVSKLQK